MTLLRQGSIRLFRFAGVDVFLHWSWFLIALYGISARAKNYSSWLWPVLEYLSLFLIVLAHEFGHSLACRQVGGEANRIVLWPLGGIAFVNPPPRPGATLWSIVAGPLVNVMLAPVLAALVFLVSEFELVNHKSDAYRFLLDICIINFVILIFNLVPVYPLDGGQILRSLLWFVVGRARSLMIATVIGFAGVAGLIALAVLNRSVWLGIIAAFILLHCWGGLMHARLLARIARLPRRDGFSCPVCHERPVIGPYWQCDKCLKTFDTFANQGACPHCAAGFAVTRCVDCGHARPMNEWITARSNNPPIL